MATLVCFHAHPDDECIQTGGTIARAASEGHRVVLVVATGGEHGETPGDLGDEPLAHRRRRETEASAATLGIARVVWLGFEDSGMTGWEQNSNTGAFCNADPDDAAERLATVLREESADILTTYDWHGGYGHPDHVMVHKVGHAAARLVPKVRVLEGTMNRDHIRRGLAMAREAGVLPPDDDWDVDGPADDGNPMGSTEDEITLAVDVAAFASAKRAAMRCHGSQLTDTGFFLSMDDERFATAFGSEWFIEPGRPGPMRWGWIFE
ncbi:MAG: PIG-L deacetylase family protein [Actinomycetota bacterium]